MSGEQNNQAEQDSKKFDRDFQDAVQKIVKKYTKGVTKTAKKKVSKKQQEIKKYRTEASRLASMANKRIMRLENKDLESSPAYNNWVRDGSVRFGVRGKNHNELQSEVARMNLFLKSETSTIRGTSKVLQEMAKNTGISYTDLTDLHSKAGQFFELASKVKQYLRTVDDMASAIGYQEIWDAVHQYTNEQGIILGEAENDIESMVKRVSKAIKTAEDKITLKEHGITGWFNLVE